MFVPSTVFNLGKYSTSTIFTNQMFWNVCSAPFPGITAWQHNWWTHSKYNGVAYRDLVLWSSTVPQKWFHAVSSILRTFIHLHHWISRLVTSNCLRSCKKICVLSRAMIEFHSSLTGKISFFVGREEARLTLVVVIVSSEKQYNKPTCLLNFIWSVKYSTNLISEHIFTDIAYIFSYSIN